jgi:hypothetical protein
MFYKYVRSIWFKTSVSFTVSLFSFCFHYLTIDKSGMLKSPTIIVWGVMCALNSSFFYECGCPCIWSIYVQNWVFFLVYFSFGEYNSLSFLMTLVESWFCPILEWLLMLVSCDYLLGKLFSSPLLRGSVCLWHWDTFPVCSKMMGPVYISSLLAYVFLLENWVIYLKRY